jgi:hypothetical protein
MENTDANLDDLYQDLARRFKAVSQFLGKLGSEKATRKLLDILISKDAEAFTRLFENMDIPDLPLDLKCIFYREVIELFLCDSYKVEVCRLRLDLTPNERVQYILIAMRHRPGQPTFIHTGIGINVLGENPEIPPGPFLDELKANHLVTCNWETRHDCKLGQLLGPPVWTCP